MIHGRASRSEREKVLEKFNEPDKPSVLLMTLKTGGVGLNLTKASYVFHLDPWWNPAAEHQGTDRAHRMGQTKPVQVYRYYMRNSVEEKMDLLKSQKQEQFDALFGDQGEQEECAESANLSGSHHALKQEDFFYLIS